MIAWLKGEVMRSLVDSLILRVGDVGYLLTVGEGTASSVLPGDALELHVHTHVREQEFSLFGFKERIHVDLFEALTTVKGVGPRVAIAILDALSPDELVIAVEGGDVRRLSSAKGVGKKVAERLAMELKGKLPASSGLDLSAVSSGTAAGPRGAVWKDLSSALANLQYKKSEIERVLEQLSKTHEETPEFDVVLRAALSALRR
jgi:holliday junction DNA helicase RuvA